MSEKQSVIKHLEEFRRRIIISCATLLFFSILFYPLTDRILLIVEDQLLGGFKFNVIVLTPFEAVLVRLKTSFLIGFLAASPIILYHTLKFTLPALEKREKKILSISLFFSIMLFFMGCLFAYQVLLPISYKILIGFATPIATPMLSLSALIDLSLTLMVISGLIFQWPLIAALLVKLKIVTSKQLSEKRRHAILASFIVSAIVTDPSFITQLILGIPMVFLYEVGIFTAKHVE